MSIEFLLEAIRRDLLDHATIVVMLRSCWADVDDESILVVLSSLDADVLQSMHSFLGVYPHNDRTWDLLPANRSDCINEPMSHSEISDVERMFFKEDRKAVEFLRKRISIELLERGI